MTRAPDWSSEEFETLISNAHLSNKELTHLLPGRTEGAIDVVRQAIHSFHTGGNTSMLSKMMRQRLETKQQPITCPICRTKF
jgi:hypothetical protein